MRHRGTKLLQIVQNVVVQNHFLGLLWAALLYYKTEIHIETLQILEGWVFLEDTVIYFGVHSFCFTSVFSLNTCYVHNPVKFPPLTGYLSYMQSRMALQPSYSEHSSGFSLKRSLYLGGLVTWRSTWECTFGPVRHITSHSCHSCTL